jgi:hypothetical protein
MSVQGHRDLKDRLAFYDDKYRDIHVEAATWGARLPEDQQGSNG